MGLLGTHRCFDKIKTVLKKVLGHSYVDFQTLATVVMETGAILNDRTLSYLNSGEVELSP